MTNVEYSKICIQCKQEFIKSYHSSISSWAKAKYCSLKCFHECRSASKRKSKRVKMTRSQIAEQRRASCVHDMKPVDGDPWVSCCTICKEVKIRVEEYQSQRSSSYPLYYLARPNGKVWQ